MGQGVFMGRLGTRLAMSPEHGQEDWAAHWLA